MTAIRKVILILGPTSVGKTDLTLKLSEKLPVEVINCDSRQIYRGMDIGTAKPKRYELEKIKHYLIDIRNPDEGYSAADFIKDANAAYDLIVKDGNIPVLAGGTFLYAKAFLKGLVNVPHKNDLLRKKFTDILKTEGSDFLHRELEKVDEKKAKQLHPNDSVRIIRSLEVYYQTKKAFSKLQEEHSFKERGFLALKIILFLDRDLLYERINRRVEKMFEDGLICEVESLLNKGYSTHTASLNTIGYKEVLAYLNGEIAIEKAKEEIKKNTRHYAKRQITWLKKEEDAVWFSYDNFDGIFSLIKNFLKQ